MIWYSVPFVGIYSKSYERFKGMYLTTKKTQEKAVLDPRFKEVRDYLTNIYATSVEKYGWDGLKLDFIDSFALSEESSCDYDKMDTVSVEEGLQMLLKETTEKLKKINPNILIEFRQSYVGPAIASFGNMFRVGDCPNDPIMNRVSSLNLRLTSGKTAVHSDMLMWNKNETNEALMYQLLSILFSVPQISVKFDNITSDHKAILKNYLSFWREKRDVILNGELSVCGIEANYTQAQSKKDGICVAALYQSVIKKLENVNEEYIFNATGNDYIYIEAEKEKAYEIYDYFGNKIKEGTLCIGACKLPLQNCYMVKIR
jgi:alpha-galactosidase